MKEKPIFPLLLSMSLPMVISMAVNSLYNIVDSYFVAKISEDAMTALSLVFPIQNFINAVAIGFGVGINAMIAQYLGAGRRDKADEALTQGMVLAVIHGIVMMILCIIGIPYFLRLFTTDANVIALGVRYATIVFSFSVILSVNLTFEKMNQAIGNMKITMISLLIGCVLNIILDPMIIFGIGPFPELGIAGAALATVTAQAFSAFYCFLSVRKIEIVHTDRDDFAKVPGLNRKLFGLGAPILFQNVIISVGGLAVQFVINGYGFLFVAGFTATNKLYGVLEMAAISYGYAVVSYVGQNLGAGEITRIKKGVHASSFLAFLTSAFISIVMFLFGKTLLSMFISGDPEQTSQVLAIAWHYLSIMASCLCILYFLYVYRSALQGLGNTMIPMLSGVVEFFVRVGVALLLPKLIGQNGIFYAEIAAWTGAAVLLMISYYINIRKFA